MKFSVRHLTLWVLSSLIISSLLISCKHDPKGKDDAPSRGGDVTGNNPIPSPSPTSGCGSLKHVDFAYSANPPNDVCREDRDARNADPRVIDAVKTVWEMAKGSDLVEGNGMIKSVGEYRKFFVNTLNNNYKDLCAQIEPGGELSVRTAADTNAQFNIFSTGRKPIQIYQGPCQPAIIPYNWPDNFGAKQGTTGCGANSSRDIKAAGDLECPRESSKFLADLRGAVGAVQREYPDYFIGCPGGTCIKGEAVESFYRLLGEKLSSYCFLPADPLIGGEAGLKSNNDFSELYQIVTSQGFIRTASSGQPVTAYDVKQFAEAKYDSYTEEMETSYATDDMGTKERNLLALAKRDRLEAIKRDTNAEFNSQSLKSKHKDTLFLLDRETTQGTGGGIRGLINSLSNLGSQAEPGEGSYRSTCYPAHF